MKMEDYNEYYIQGSDHYLIPKDVFMEIFNEMINWKEESQKQKDVLDKGIKYVEDYTSGERIITYEQYKSELLNILKEVSE